MKNGTAAKEWSTTNCPLSKKCPYYDTVKAHPEKMEACPLAHACPHFKKGEYKNEQKDVKSCPFYKKEEEVKVDL